MSLNIKVKYVNDYFLNKHIKIDAEWLEGCVQFFFEENPTTSKNQLCAQAQEQWELSNLSDSGVPCLPQSIRIEKACQQINGTFPVQMQYLIDISESAYDQLQIIRDSEVDMVKEKPEFKQSQQAKTKKKRVLKLELTDGYQVVTAMEYSPIPCLKTSLVPGIKMLLIGPIRCINHCLLIESKNIQILAGEVSTMTVKNAYENILRRILNQPINPNLKTEDTDQPVLLETQKNSLNIPSIPMSATKVTQPSLATTNTMDVDVFNDDDLFCDIDVDQLTSRITTSTEIPHKMTERNSRTNPRTLQTSVMLFDDDMDDDEFLQIDSPHIAPQQNTHIQMDSISDDELSEISSEPSLVSSKNLSICHDNYPFKIRGVNLVTLKQLNECSVANRLRRKHFLVKAEIDSIKEKVRVSRESNTFKLGVLLKDSPPKQDRLQVRFSSEVLEKLGSVSPREIKEMFAKQESHPQVIDDIEEILDRLGMRLAELNAFLKIEFINDMKAPVVVEVIRSATVLERKLKEKLTNENLLN